MLPLTPATGLGTLNHSFEVKTVHQQKPTVFTVTLLATLSTQVLRAEGEAGGGGGGSNIPLEAST